MGEAGRTLIPNIFERTRGLGHVADFGPPDEFKESRGKEKHIRADALASEFRLNLETFVGICRMRSITPVLMTQANRFKDEPDSVESPIAGKLREYGASPEEFKEAYRLFNETIRVVAEDNGVPLIDLAARIPQDKKFIYDLVHYNDAGSRLAAQIISDSLQEMVMARSEPGGKESRERVPAL